MIFGRIIVLTLCLLGPNEGQLWAAEATPFKEGEVKLSEAQKSELSIKDLLKKYREKNRLSN